MVWNDQKFKFWLGLFVSLGPNTIDHYFFYHLALWWLWCSGSCLAPRQSPASWPQRASTWTAGSQVLIFLMQPWPVSAALFVEGNLSFTCTLYFWTFVLGCGAQCFCCLFCDKWQNPIFLLGSTTTRYGKEPEFIPGGACDVSRASRRLLAWIQQHFKKAVGETYSQNSSSESHGTVEVRATKLQRPLHFQGYHNICLRPVSSTCQDEMCISGASHFS